LVSALPPIYWREAVKSVMIAGWCRQQLKRNMPISQFKQAE